MPSNTGLYPPVVVYFDGIQRLKGVITFLQALSGMIGRSGVITTEQFDTGQHGMDYPRMPIRRGIIKSTHELFNRQVIHIIRRNKRTGINNTTTLGGIQTYVGRIHVPGHTTDKVTVKERFFFLIFIGKRNIFRYAAHQVIGQKPHFTQTIQHTIHGVVIQPNIPFINFLEGREGCIRYIVIEKQRIR